MNSFDAVVYLALVAAAVLGFNSGLLRSAVTILAYLIAMPIAIWSMSLVPPAIITRRACAPAGYGAGSVVHRFAE